MKVTKISTALIDVPEKYADRVDLLGDIDESSTIFSLASNIAELGLLQPIVLREKEDGRYTVVAGKRRLAAYKMLEISREDDYYGYISASILKKDDSDEIADYTDVMATLSENRHRKDIDPLFFANTFFAAITISIAKNENLQLSTKEDVELIGKCFFEYQNYVRNNLNSPKKAKEVVEKFKSENDLFDEFIIFNAIDKIIFLLGYSKSGMKKKLTIVSMDNNLQTLIRLNKISYAAALKAHALKKKTETRGKYDAFMKAMIAAVESNESVSNIIETFLSSKKIFVQKKRVVAKLKKQTESIVDKLARLPSESEKFISITKILANIDKELSK